MSILSIRQAKREAARLVFGFSGISGSGKTRTAIEFAYGLAGFDASKIGFIDVENKRGSLYADVLRNNKTHPTDQPFWIGDLEPPFSPARYTQAIREFEAHSVEVLIIDSVTHEWEGTGGAQEIAENNKLGRSPNWAMAKKEHKKFMNALLQSNMHIICCVRAREKIREDKDEVTGKKIIVQLGIQPVQEKNFIFEMTASLTMHNEGQFQMVDKCPEDLKPFLGRGNGYITSEDGAAVRTWVENGVHIDPRVEALRSKLKAFTEQGAAALEEKWQMLNEKQKEAVGHDYYATLLESAREYDTLAKPENDDASDLNEALA